MKKAGSEQILEEDKWFSFKEIKYIIKFYLADQSIKWIEEIVCEK